MFWQNYRFIEKYFQSEPLHRGLGLIVMVYQQLPSETRPLPRAARRPPPLFHRQQLTPPRQSDRTVLNSHRASNYQSLLVPLAC